MSDDKILIDGHRVAAERLDDWRVLRRALHTRLLTGGFAAGAALVAEIARVADAANHHPDVELRYPHVDVRLTSHDVDGLTMRDVRLAREISALAARAGVRADPAAVSVAELCLDVADRSAVRPFWAAVLGLPEGDPTSEEVADPAGALPVIWFQRTEPHQPPRQRFHLDVHVPHEAAEARVEAAVAAGGTLVSDAEAPAFWVLADAEGNKACVCTWQGRDDAA